MKRLAAFAALLLAPCVCANIARAAGTRADLDGVWLFYGAQIPKEPGLTPAGQEKLQQYDPLRDDSDTLCKPVTFTNIMHTPSPPIEIRQHADHVEINYEFMDVHRRVPLDAALANAPYTVADHPHMGRSVGRYEGQFLIVETDHFLFDITGFDDYNGIPSSSLKKVTEKY